MAAPYASAAIWKTFIQQPAIVFLETLLAQVQMVRQTDPAFKTPTLKVFKDCFHSDLRDLATTMLGIDFSTEPSALSASPNSSNSSNPSLLSPTSGSNNSPSDHITMSVLQFSVVSLFIGKEEDADQREMVVEMLVKV